MEDIIIDMSGCDEQSLNEALKVTGSRDSRVRVGALTLGSENIGAIRNQGAGSVGSFGQTLRSMLSLGAGYSVEVSDFGEVVTVKMTYTNTRTCKSSSINCVILFYDNGQCRAKIHSARWRTCNDIGQAASYLRSKASKLQSMTSYAE